MRKKHRGIPVMVMSGLLAMALGGCGGGTSSESGAEGKSSQEAGGSSKGPSDKPVELTVYSAPGDSEESWNERFGDPIRKKFPNISFKFINPRNNDAQKLPNLIVAGTTIDLYYESIGGFFVNVPQYNLQYDLTPLIKQNNIDLDSFEPTLIEAMKNNSGGQIWGLPVNNNNMVMYYNKDIFDRFGVAYPKDGMTWDEAIEMSQQFNKTEEGRKYAGLAVSPNHIIRMNPFSLPVVDAKTNKSTFADEKWKTLLQTMFVRPAASEGYKDKIRSLGNKLPYATEFTRTQDLAMYVHQSNLPFIDSTYQTTNFDMVSFPTFKDMPGIGSQAYPTYFAIPANSEHKEEAFQAIQYLVSGEYQMEYSKKGVMPVLKDESYKKVFATETRYTNVNFAAVFRNQFAPIPNKTNYDGIAEGALTSQLIDLSLNNTDLNSVLRKAEEDANNKIETEKAKK
ncbi:glycerol-3-phosphate transporter periplasmic binding protein [Paenibacillus konkukensis]|uniref:Glycerol-3-phosphate transporter periplasmic binding protein n=1 Tax=Paenibacillus konkukensis TaxID=2020716 RepID=A0ABY4S1M4_9BACL|nr:extracellular solute-binding protein [Paenibacillus konkukensis]UQZ87634.1 glycerol-3-phosphate transporter periplasmic binding protein [Paenibacillus konkukensis]